MLVYHRVTNYACASLARAAARCLTSSAAPSDSSSSSTSSQTDSIFATKESPWDRILGDSINDIPPILPTPARKGLRAGGLETPGHTRARRQAMTAREVSAFDEMFNMIFDAVSEQKNPSARLSPQKDDPLAVLNGIGRKPFGQAPMTDLFGKLRRHSKRLKWTTEADQEFDKKKEEMELCDTDQQLLEWAMREVFGQSQQYEERARNAIAKAEEQHAPTPAASNANANASANPQPQLTQPASSHPDLQHPTYPYLIAHLMRSFRDKYRDPHLALSIFDYARHLSIPSYVFGCTTPAYNELIETRWSCFRDLKGVHDALEEMRVNGVEPDGRTKKLVEKLRREVGARTIWEEESVFGSGEVIGMLAKIEQLAIKEPRRKQGKGKASGKQRAPAFDAWKGDALKEDLQDGYEFGQWSGSRKPKPKPRRREQDSERTGLDDWLDGKIPGEDRLEFK
ncbi:hypothetical protein DEU56DRAFT_743291 [Suillus clintonianus]|uniref:uncharacterized protein n=1 Tax=Suillus clintonianus TaxID=1904413 RepID=UPI001B87571F|nr:uncharacterized protein DEU56DRAFT_743291 [Suillus clintonianus]KAG2125968.1 hypothetical protein DEU56DRAFT_743291 [Suillus clintonianus]